MKFRWSILSLSTFQQVDCHVGQLSSWSIAKLVNCQVGQCWSVMLNQTGWQLLTVPPPPTFSSYNKKLNAYVCSALFRALFVLRCHVFILLTRVIKSWTLLGMRSQDIFEMKIFSQGWRWMCQRRHRCQRPRRRRRRRLRRILAAISFQLISCHVFNGKIIL